MPTHLDDQLASRDLSDTLVALGTTDLAAAILNEVERSADLPDPIRNALINTAAAIMTHCHDVEIAANEANALLVRTSR